MTVLSCARCLRTAVVRRPLFAAGCRSFSSAPLLRTAATTTTAQPKLSTPTTGPGEAAPEPAEAPKSICVEGTVLAGLNYHNNGQDPVALKDSEYPAWLWTCLETSKKKVDGDDDKSMDEFSTSKKQRRLAAKRKSQLEAELIASGNLEALQPKVPLSQQSINLPGEEGGSLTDNLEAAAKRQELKVAMRKERKAKIKESNYLKTM